MARSAYDYALDLLSARAYTTRNLRRKILQKGFAEGEAESAVGRLTDNGLLDDATYAAEFARQKLVVGGAAAKRVRQQLAQKGIDARTAADAIQRVLEDEPQDPTAAMEKIALKKLRALRGVEPKKLRQRLFGFLARKGYEVDDVNRVLSRILN